jgi:hypothetical protein
MILSLIPNDLLFRKKEAKMQNKDKKYDSKFIRKSLRFSSSEYEQIESQLTTLGVSFTQFAKHAIINHQITIPIQMDLIYELNRIGNNLNQIAKSVNSKQKIAVLTQLVEIEKQLQKLQYKQEV